MRNPFPTEPSPRVDPHHHLVNLLIIKVGEMLETLRGLARFHPQFTNRYRIIVNFSQHKLIRAYCVVTSILQSSKR